MARSTDAWVNPTGGRRSTFLPSTVTIFGATPRWCPTGNVRYTTDMRCAFVRVVTVLLSIAGIWPATSVSAEERLLDGKLRIQIAEGWKPDAKKPKSLAAWSRGDAWGEVLRGTHGLKPNDLARYKDSKVAEYTKGLAWMPNLTWLKKDIVKRDGRSWMDLRFIGLREGAKNNRDGVLYTRFLSTSYQGQLLEITFTSNLDENPATKDAIDRMVDSVKLVE